VSRMADEGERDYMDGPALSLQRCSEAETQKTSPVPRGRLRVSALSEQLCAGRNKGCATH
jgi:hypothetical protein